MAYQVFVAQACRLPYQARNQALLRVTSHDWLNRSALSTRAVLEETVSPWERQSSALFAASRLLHRASAMIEHAETDQVAATGNLRHRIQTLADDIAEICLLCQRAGAEPDTDELAGLSPEQLKAELAARELAAYDATLRARLPQPNAATTLRVSYRDGQVTTSQLDDAAAGFVGYAPTPTAALDLVATAAAPTAPALRLDPPDRAVRRPAAYTGQGSPSPDMRADWFDTLLDPAVPQMSEHLRACRARQLELTGVNVDDYLHQHAEVANASTPQLDLRLDFLCYLDTVDPALGDNGLEAVGRTVQWVPTRLVVRTERTQRWNDFTDAHPETVPRLVHALRDTNDLEAFTRRLFTEGPIRLDHIPGPAGPLYTLTDDGTHRTHLARLLDLPFVLADVTVHSLPRTFHLITMVTRDPARRPADLITDQHLQARHDLWQGLRRRGIIDAELTENRHCSLTHLRHRRLPAFWWLCAPATATRVNAEYERLYPGTLTAQGIPTEIGTDPDAWPAWLTIKRA